ncbi:MAG: hypothetical protein CNIPEHKO_02430 [Anaerolineales bacterium]|nr:hypothetical protein [Anaerolineales bacterium]
MKFIALLLLIVMLLSIRLFPTLTFILGGLFLFFSLALGIISIFMKHKQSENPRIKIVKEILVLIFTLALAMLLGGMAGMYANHYAAQRFGIIPGILSALVASFVIGYIVRWGIGRAVSRSEKQFSPR